MARGKTQCFHCKYNKANDLRKTLVAKGEITYELMEDNKTRMYRLVE